MRAKRPGRGGRQDIQGLERGPKGPLKGHGRSAGGALKGELSLWQLVSPEGKKKKGKYKGSGVREKTRLGDKKRGGEGAKVRGKKSNKGRNDRPRAWWPRQHLIKKKRSSWKKKKLGQWKPKEGREKKGGGRGGTPGSRENTRQGKKLKGKKQTPWEMKLRLGSVYKPRG